MIPAMGCQLRGHHLCRRWIVRSIEQERRAVLHNLKPSLPADRPKARANRLLRYPHALCCRRFQQSQRAGCVVELMGAVQGAGEIGVRPTEAFVPKTPSVPLGPKVRL